ncbi:hypothetical protein Dimus_039173 [Dionaea muscipula]
MPSFVRGRAIICWHCSRMGHVRRRCWQIHDPSPIVPCGMDQAQQVFPQFVSSTTFVQSTSSAQSAAYMSASSRDWIIDSGASDHITGSLRLLHKYSTTSSYLDVRVADGSYVSIRGVGMVPLTPTLTIPSVLYLPDLPFNLLSVSALSQTHRCRVLFCANSCEIQELSTGTLLGRGHRTSGGLYILDVDFFNLACSGVSFTLIDLHNRLGHPSLSSFKRLCPEARSVSQLFCESCQFAKHHKATYVPRSNTRASTPFELIHSDIWGSCPIQSGAGFRYFVTFVMIIPA